MTSSELSSDRDLYTVHEAAFRLSIGLTMTRALISSGELRSIKVRKARRVPADAITEYISRLNQEQNG